MSKLLQNNKLISSILVSAGILVTGLLLDHNKVAFIVLAIFLFSIDLNNHFLNLSKSGKYSLAKATILLLLLCDLAYTFYLQYHCPIDGDLAEVVLPSQQYSKVLTDPFGFSILFHHARYNAPNRFFLHWTAYKYFNTAPFIFRHFASPIDSLYLASALSKVLIKMLMIYVLSAFISGSYKIFNKDFLLAALLTTPLLQTCGYVWDIGIIDPTVTGAFAYTLSIGLFALFFMPFFMKYYHQQKLQMNYGVIALLVLFLLVIVFFGPVNAPLIIIICPSLLFYQWWLGMKRNSELPLLQNTIVSIRQIPTSVLITFILALLFSVYSFYIGGHNGENFLSTVPLIQRYMQMPHGIYSMYFNKAMGLLSLLILANIIMLIRNSKDPDARRILWLFPWIILFSVVYTLLLPLGGYRVYRPYIVRRDTMEPVLIAVFIFYGISTFYMLKHINTQMFKKIYSGCLAILLLYFVVSNNNNKFDNSCERSSLQQLAASKEKIVHLNADCDVLYWGKITDYRDSKTVTGLLLRYKIINEEKYFYQK